MGTLEAADCSVEGGWAVDVKQWQGEQDRRSSVARLSEPWCRASSQRQRSAADPERADGPSRGALGALCPLALHGVSSAPALVVCRAGAGRPEA